jgi:hypothetical protein
MDDGDDTIQKINPSQDFCKIANSLNQEGNVKIIDGSIDMTSRVDKSHHESPLLKNNTETKEFIVDDLEIQWNYRIMLQLKRTGERSSGYRWMHNEELIHFTYLLRKITLAEIIFSVIHGITITGSIVALVEDSNNKVLMVSLICVQAILYVITNILKTWKEGAEFPKKIYDHRWSCIKFGQIATKIQNQFCLSIGKRDNDENFLEYTSSDFNDTMFGAPVIRPKTKKQYLDGTKYSNIYKPMSLGNMDNIDIVIDKNDNDATIINLPTQNVKVNKRFEYEMDRFIRFC